MFSQTIDFALPDGTTEDHLMAACRAAARDSRRQPGLLLRIFDYDEAARRGRVTSIWNATDAAVGEAAEQWLHGLSDLYGEPVQVHSAKTLLIVDTSVDELVTKAIRADAQAGPDRIGR